MMRLSLPWPDYAKLSPNAKRKLHWRKYQPAAKAHRAAVYYTARSQGAWPMDADTLAMTVTFHEPDNRGRDQDGCIGAWKHGQDGLADALGMDDRAFVVTYRMGDPVKGGAVVVEIAESAETPAKQGDSA
jgi:crossover junction endodeoxyribonuclease RusA